MNLNMFTLIAMGIGVAYSYSVAAVSFRIFFPPHFAGMERSAVYFEAATVITVLVLLGQMLELKARSRTGECDSCAPGSDTTDTRVLRGGDGNRDSAR